MYLEKKGNKYNSKITTYQGIACHSAKEADFAKTLDALKKATLASERVVSWERQVKISLDMNGFHIANYYCDFLATFADDHQELIEVKGFETEIYRLKRKILEATYLHEHPEITYVVIK